MPIPADITTKVKGDQHCATVATAAVIAKVTRDRLMVDLAQSNPRYAAYEWLITRAMVPPHTVPPSPNTGRLRSIVSHGT